MEKFSEVVKVLAKMCSKSVRITSKQLLKGRFCVLIIDYQQFSISSFIVDLLFYRSHLVLTNSDNLDQKLIFQPSVIC